VANGDIASALAEAAVEPMTAIVAMNHSTMRAKASQPFKAWRSRSTEWVE
jgi:hypothetical protein